MALIRTLRPLAVLAATAALFGGLTVQAATADDPVVSKLTLGADQFKMTDTSYESATNNLYNNVLTNHVDLTDVVTTDFTKNSSGATDTWMNLRSMRACSRRRDEGAAAGDQEGRLVLVLGACRRQHAALVPAGHEHHRNRRRG